MVSFLGSLVQSCCGEGWALLTDVTGMCGEYSQCSSHTGFAPTHGVCDFPVYNAQAPGFSIGSGPCVACGSSFWVLHKCADLFGPEFYAFPGLSSSGSQELDEHTLSGCGVAHPLQGPRLSFHVQVGCAFCLFWGAGL